MWLAPPKVMCVSLWWRLLPVLYMLRTSSGGMPSNSPSRKSNTTISNTPILQNFCERLKQLANVSDLSVNGVNALSGKTIIIGVNLDTPRQMLTFDRVTKRPNGGLIYLVQQMLSQRGDFNIQYQTTLNISGFSSTDKFLQVVLPTVDIYGGNAIAETGIRRMKYSFDFVRDVADKSIILISPGAVKPTSNISAFLLPFNDELWCYVAAVIVATAVIYYLIERYLRVRVEEGAEQPELVPFYLVAYSTALHLTMMEGAFKPTSLATQILQIGYKWFMLVTTAAYLANQANLLIAPNIITVKVLTIPEAIKNSRPVCALAGISPMWCMDCVPGMGSPISIVKGAHTGGRLPSLFLVPPSSLLPPPVSFVHEG